MTTINFTIPDEKIQRVIHAMKGIYPIPTTTDEGNETNDFTDSEWAKEAVRRFVVNTVRRYENKIAIENAQVEGDDEIIQ